MRVLVDTSILLRYVDSDDPKCTEVRRCISDFLRRGYELGMSPQAHREFWSVVTRPREQNGLGRSPNDAEELINVLEIVFEFWDDMPGIASTWRNIVLSLEIKGVQVHDANHAATAIVHGATHVLTLDLKDFDRYRKFGITPLLPDGL